MLRKKKKKIDRGINKLLKKINGKKFNLPHPLFRYDFDQTFKKGYDITESVSFTT